MMVRGMKYCTRHSAFLYHMNTWVIFMTFHLAAASPPAGISWYGRGGTGAAPGCKARWCPGTTTNSIVIKKIILNMIFSKTFVHSCLHQTNLAHTKCNYPTHQPTTVRKATAIGTARNVLTTQITTITPLVRDLDAWFFRGCMIACAWFYYWVW